MEENIEPPENLKHLIEERISFLEWLIENKDLSAEKSPKPKHRFELILRYEIVYLAYIKVGKVK